MNLLRKIWRNSFRIRYNIVPHSITFVFLRFVLRPKRGAHCNLFKVISCFFCTNLISFVFLVFVCFCHYFCLKVCVFLYHPFSLSFSHSFYSSLTLNFLTLTTMKNIVIEKSTRVSFQTYRKPVPLIITLLIIVIKYLGGNK